MTVREDCAKWQSGFQVSWEGQVFGDKLEIVCGGGWR